MFFIKLDRHYITVLVLVTCPRQIYNCPTYGLFDGGHPRDRLCSR